MPNQENRRKRPRVPAQKTIRHSEYQSMGTPVFQENSSVDLSSGGISFETKREYKKGSLVFLEVEIQSEKLKLLVCVAWIKKGNTPDTYQVGAELVAVNPEDKQKMNSHLSQMIEELQSKKVAKKTTKKATNKKTAQKKTEKKTKNKTLKKKPGKKKPSKKKPAKKKPSKK